ncbi:glutaredoxin-like protein NrdH [Brachybacterium sp. AOP35-5H-19]|uniref:glutaredoxin-like protein NrdH n=1 Tax=Brachybacterium sp. AOP35-5H-19 TaxID=3457685 RepID=UPI0040338CE2
MNVTVYTKPQCVQCDATKRALTSSRIRYETVDLTEDPKARAAVQALGYLQAPVVVTSEDHWSGFRPDKIKALAPGPSSVRGGQSGLDPAAPRGRIAL